MKKSGVARFHRECFPGALRDGVGARKLKQFLARRLHSSTRLAVSEAHGLVWVEQETLGRDTRTKAITAATYISPSLAEVDRRPVTASNCIRDFELTAKVSLVGVTEVNVGNAVKNSFDPKVFLAKVGKGKTILEFHSNQIVFAQGEVADTVFYIQEGRVKLTVSSEQGKEAVVGILEPGQFFGEGCMNGRPLRIATTTAMEECVITSITREAMIELLREEPKFSELFMAYLLKRNGRIQEDLIDQLFYPSEKRLARLLLLLANFGKDGSPQPINPNISQETLAEMIGTTRSRVNFFMNKFRKLGLISYNGKIEVYNSLLNAVLHEKPEIERGEPTSEV
jgi:CRP/FNR family cyclic AMP-dependent transcriptional regulator